LDASQFISYCSLLAGSLFGSELSVTREWLSDGSGFVSNDVFERTDGDVEAIELAVGAPLRCCSLVHGLAHDVAGVISSAA